MLFLLCKNSAYADEPSENGVNTEGPVKATEDAIESPVNVTEADTEGPSKESLRLDLENILKDQSVDQELLQVSKISSILCASGIRVWTLG